jgi:CheY-like chemotaxis protein
MFGPTNRPDEQTPDFCFMAAVIVFRTGQALRCPKAMAKFSILLVEDDDNDVLLIQRALKKHYVERPVYVARNGEEAIEYLTGGGIFKDRETYPFPDVVITDLKMPKLSGFELLAWINEHKEYRVIPTIVLSSSKEDKDVTRAYDLGANTYMVKPTNFDALAEMVKQIRDYWELSIKPRVKRN